MYMYLNKHFYNSKNQPSQNFYKLTSLFLLITYMVPFSVK